MTRHCVQCDAIRDVAPTVSLLQTQLATLTAAIDLATANGQPEAAAMAQRYAARVSAALDQPPLAIEDNAGWYGENGWAPAIDAICWGVVRTPVGMPAMAGVA